MQLTNTLEVLEYISGSLLISSNICFTVIVSVSMFSYVLYIIETVMSCTTFLRYFGYAVIGSYASCYVITTW